MPLRRSQRLANGASHAVGFFVLLGFGLASPAMPLLADDLRLTVTGVGTAIGAFGVGRLIFGLGSIWGLTTARRMLHPGWLVGGCLLTAVAAIWCAIATDGIQLIAARAVQGSGSSMAMLAASIRPFVAEEGNVGRRLGDQQTVFLLGTAVGPIVGGALAQFAGLHSPFWVTAALALCGIPCGLVAQRFGPRAAAMSTESPPTDAGNTPRRRLVALSAATMIALGVVALATASRSGFRTMFFPVWGYDVLGLSETVVGVALSVGALGFLSFALVGRLTDILGPRPVLVAGGILLVISSGLVLVVPAVWSGFVSMVLSTVGASSAIVAAGTMIIGAGAGSRRLLAIRNQRVATDLGIFLGPVLMGVAMGAWGYTGALVSLTVASIGIIVAAFVVRPAPPVQQTQKENV